MLDDRMQQAMLRFARRLWDLGLKRTFDGDFWIGFNSDWDLNVWEEELPDRLAVWVTAYPVVNGVLDSRSFHRLGEIAKVAS